MNDAIELRSQLRQFTGCEQPYCVRNLPAVVYTDGFRHFVQNAGGGAGWLLDILGTQPEILNAVRKDGFAMVLLRVNGTQAVLTVENGNDGAGRVVYYQRHIDYTDCPQLPFSPTEADPHKDCWKFYMETTYMGGKPKIMIMLPGER